MRCAGVTGPFESEFREVLLSNRQLAASRASGDLAAGRCMMEGCSRPDRISGDSFGEQKLQNSCDGRRRVHWRRADISSAPAGMPGSAWGGCQAVRSVVSEVRGCGEPLAGL